MKVKQVGHGFLCCLMVFILAFSLCSCFDSEGGVDGLSAYEIAVQNGFNGSETEWLNSLKGEGVSIKSIYNEAVENGYEGDFLSFLKEYLTYDNNDISKAGVLPESSGISSSLLSSVSVRCQFEYKVSTGYGFFGGGGTTTKTASQSGSGVIYQLDKEAGNAYIITNYHVVYYYAASNTTKISDDIKVYLYGSETEKYAIDATYVGGSMNYDIAVLKITDSDVLKNSSCMAISVKDSNLVTVGDTAIAIGNAEGEGISVTKGIVSVDSEYIQMTACDNVSTVSYRLLRVDTAINSGNSGGGLFDENGDLIGIVNAKVSSSSVENIGYAIPSNIATYVADNIIDTCDGETNVKPSKCILGITLGVSGSTAYYDTENNTTRIKETVYLTSVESGTISYGILQAGDIINSITIGGVEYTIDRSFIPVDIMLTCRVGDTVSVNYTRSGTVHTSDFVLTSSSLITVN